MSQLEYLRDQSWDAVVIGTGMGGATAGYMLACSGLKVLFLEKGAALHEENIALRGDYPESLAGRSKDRALSSELLKRSGRWPEQIVDVSQRRTRSFVPFIGCGTGGSTLLYGAALERFYPSDFIPRMHYPDAHNASLVERWPITFEELDPYYAAAEQLYRVQPSNDPLRPENQFSSSARAASFSPVGQEFSTLLKDQGLHPYTLPVAEHSHSEECPGCQGFLCQTRGKRDSLQTCLLPALTKYGAELCTDCEVTSLDATHDRVTRIHCIYRQKHRFTIKADQVILAAGALHTPHILLKSRSAQWPYGLANRSGLVGRNLMRHYVDLYAVEPRSGAAAADIPKELACNDLYATAGGKYGTVQSFGSVPPPEVMMHELLDDLAASRWAPLAPMVRRSSGVMKRCLARLFKGRVLFASIMEDLPYVSNRVSICSSDPRLRLSYRISRYEQNRIREFRRQVRAIFAKYRCLFLPQAESNLRIAHVCGTCRFGDDPATSVLDSSNRAHGIDNLYVVDASFFPSSAGINPALTIAANALRVADHIAQHRGARYSRQTRELLGITPPPGKQPSDIYAIKQ